MPCNRDAGRASLAASTQWRIAPCGHLAGLDYTGARAAARGIGLKWRAVFEGVRVMEAAVLSAQSERSSSS